MGGKGRSPVREEADPVEALLPSPGSRAAVCRCINNKGPWTAWEASNDRRPALGDYPSQQGGYTMQRGWQKDSQVLLRH